MIVQLLIAALAIIPQPQEMRTESCTLPVETPIQVKTDASIAPEGYWLDVMPEGLITITSSDAAGEFYARQTLKQLLDWRGYRCAPIE